MFCAGAWVSHVWFENILIQFKWSTSNTIDIESDATTAVADSIHFFFMRTQILGSVMQTLIISQRNRALVIFIELFQFSAKKTNKNVVGEREKKEVIEIWSIITAQ